MTLESMGGGELYEMKKISLLLCILMQIGFSIAAEKPKKSRDQIRLNGYMFVVTANSYDPTTGLCTVRGVHCYDPGPQRCRTFSIAEIQDMGYNYNESVSIFNLFEQSDLLIEQNSPSTSISQTLTFQLPDNSIVTKIYTISWATNSSGLITQDLTVTQLN